MTRLRVRENGTVKKRRDSKHAKDVLDEAQAFFKLKILAMMALCAQMQDMDPTLYLVCALINGVIIEDIQLEEDWPDGAIEAIECCENLNEHSVISVGACFNAQVI